MSAYLSVKEASQLAGVSKSALFKAIGSGRLSAEKAQDGAWKIQVVELERVYSLNGHSAPSNGNSIPEMHAVPQEVYTPSTDSPREQVTMLERVIAANEETMRAKDALIDVLTQENARLSAVVAELQPPAARKGWWARLLGQS